MNNRENQFGQEKGKGVSPSLVENVHSALALKLDKLPKAENGNDVLEAVNDNHVLEAANDNNAEFGSAELGPLVQKILNGSADILNRDAA